MSFNDSTLNKSSSTDKLLNANEVKSSNKKILKLDKTTVLTNGNQHTASFVTKKIISNDQPNSAKVLTLVKKHFVNNNSDIKAGSRLSDKNTVTESNVRHHQYDKTKSVSLASSSSSSTKPIIVLKNISEMTSVKLSTKPGNCYYIN